MSPLRLASLVALLVVLVLGVPLNVRTAPNNEMVLYDLFARDAGRGAVLYRDMVDNRPPGVFAVHRAVRAAVGWSNEGLHAVDLAVVGAAFALLVGLLPTRPAGVRAFALAVLAAFYLSVLEWQHVQADTWALLPAALALRLRRRQLGRLAGGGGRGTAAWGVLEGLAWGAAVWLKPHLLLVAASAWAAGAAWAWRAGVGGRRVAADAAAVFVGGLVAGGAGVAAMAAGGLLGPYLNHAREYLPEYFAADLYGPGGRWRAWQGVLVRNTPWAFAYLAGVGVAVGVIGQDAFGKRSAGDVAGDAGPPGRLLLAAAVVGWAAQAWGLQHVFDYVHTGGMALALALLIGVAASLPGRAGPAALAAVGAVAAVGFVGSLPGRVDAWAACVSGPDTPALRDRLARLSFTLWEDAAAVSLFVRRDGLMTGELAVLPDSLMPVWIDTGLSPPGRFFMVTNNLIGFAGRRAEIVRSLQTPRLRAVAVDLRLLRAENLALGLEAAPLPADWYGPRRWADRVRFRAGPYAVVAVTADELPRFLADVSVYDVVGR